jgi:hypothetical protein
MYYVCVYLWWDWGLTKGFTLAKQVLLSHTSSTKFTFSIISKDTVTYNPHYPILELFFYHTKLKYLPMK